MKKLIRFLLAAVAVNGVAALAQDTARVPLDGYSVELKTIDDYDVTTGQTIGVDPDGFDVKVKIVHRGQAIAHRAGPTLGPADAAVLSGMVVRYQVFLPSGEELVLPAMGACSPNGDVFSHLSIDRAAITKLEAANNPDITIRAALAPKDAGIDPAFPASTPVHLTLDFATLRSSGDSIPYVFRKADTIALSPKFAEPQTMDADDAFLSGKTPAVPASTNYFMWMRYSATNSTLAHFMPISVPANGDWKASLSSLPPDTYRVVAFASPHGDSATFAGNGWRSDAYAISPEATVTVVAPHFHFSALALTVLFAILFLGAAAIMIFRTPHREPAAGTEAEQGSDLTPRPLSFTAKAHHFLACVLFVLAIVTVVNYYDFFTTIVASALRNEAITTQDWNNQNSGGISLLIMSYSISLGLAVELGIYKLITLGRHRRFYGFGAMAFLYTIWLAVIAAAAWCAFAFIIHIGEFYSTQPALRELGHLAGSAELVIFFAAIAGLMPMEHEHWPKVAKRPKVEPTPTAVVQVPAATPESLLPEVR